LPALSFLSAAAAFWLLGCTASLGPGYLIERQEIRVSFRSRPEPGLEISAEYRLRNIGNQALDSLEVRLPGRRFRPTSSEAGWDDRPLALAPSPDNPRDTLVALPASWKVGEAHSLRFRYGIPSSPAEDDALGFAPDAFYLPSEGWTPQLPQPRGLFGFGGVPPRKWDLLVRVPEGFLVHASGGQEKHSAKGGEVEYRFSQTSGDLRPFVVAGRYRETDQTLGPGLRVHLWTREIPDGSSLKPAGESLAAALSSYDALVGARAPSSQSLWIVECPQSAGCLPGSTGYGSLVYTPGVNRSAALVSRDAVVVDPRAAGGKFEASAGPAFAAGWLGYGQNPGFYEQQPPVSALPAFAAALAREASEGPAVRQEVVGRALDQVPREAGADSNQDPNVVRAKSLLLFYALRDLAGAEAFQKALQHMLFARQGRGFDVRDLISALEEESHQPVGPFVRRWIKGPGVPKEFRDRYSESLARQESLAPEAKQ
jgi:hypothetical protein